MTLEHGLDSAVEVGHSSPEIKYVGGHGADDLCGHGLSRHLNGLRQGRFRCQVCKAIRVVRLVLPQPGFQPCSTNRADRTGGLESCQQDQRAFHIAEVERALQPGKVRAQ